MENNKLKELDKVLQQEQLISDISVKLNKLSYEEQRKYIKNYYDQVLAMFETTEDLNLENYIIYIYNTYGLDKAREEVYEKFNDNNFENESSKFNNNQLFKEVFLKLKQSFLALLNDLGNNNSNLIVKDKRNIKKVLDDVKLEKASILSSNDMVSLFVKIQKDKLEVIKRNIELEIRNDKLVNLLNDINTLSIIISKVLESDIDSNAIRNNIIHILSYSGKLDNFGFYKNRFVNFITEQPNNNRYCSNGLSFKENYEDLIEAIEGNCIDEKQVKYYKDYVSKNINKYLLYNMLQDRVDINIKNCRSLILNVIYSNFVINIVMGSGKIDYSKIDAEFKKKLISALSSIIDNYSEEELIDLTNLYISGIDKRELSKERKHKI